MFTQLFEAIASAWTEHLAPYAVIDEYEMAGVLRGGKYHRTLGPGIHPRWPLWEVVWNFDTVMRTIRLQPQSCTTKDGKSVVVCGVLKFRLADVKPYLCGVVDQKDVLIDVCMGAVLAAVRDTSFDDLVKDPPESKIAAKVRREVKQFGFEIFSFTFTDIGQVRSIRLIQQTPMGGELSI